MPITNGVKLCHDRAKVEELMVLIRITISSPKEYQ